MEQVCVLTGREIARFKNWRIVPDCEEHCHVTPQEALDGLASGAYDWFHSEREPWVAWPKEHYLAVRPSGCLPIVQRVELNGPMFVEEAR